MSHLPDSHYIQASGCGYRIAGTRISLESIACAVRRGEMADEIMADFPALESRAKLEGVMAFVQSHPREIEEYLAEQSGRWDDARKDNPPNLVDKARRYRKEKDLKPA
jgi:uncharacterized protein (DUF433 family)